MERTICISSKVNGRQPSIQDMVYDTNGCATAITTCFMPSIIVAMRGRGGIGNTHQQLEPNWGGVSNTLTSVTKDNLVMENKDKKELGFRIRKLTERECFRLMGVHEEDIDKLLSSGISKSQLYKMAGNSIVAEGVLTGIFTKLFVETEPTVGTQLTIF